mgnify:CR=1 FL=1
MKEKKDFKNTKFGQFINKAKDFAPELLQVAGKIATGNVIGAVSEVGSILKKESTKSAEAKVLLNEFKLLEMEFEKEMEEGITDRWKSDMTSDSWLSKNVRPLALMYLTFSATLLIVLDSALEGFKVGEEWIFLLKSLLLSVYIAYFGSRGVEKYKKIK